MNDGTTPLQATSSFVNPLTVLCMVETMKAENHTAIINTAAASNLGQMLVKVCAKDNIPIVCVVRREAQVKTLKDLGAKYVVNSSDETFKEDLINAIEATGATLAFNAIGGGTMTDTLLDAMEKVLVKSMKVYNRYGSDTLKQVYNYGGLNPGPTTLNRTYGMSWAVGGWLLTYRLRSLSPEKFEAIKQRIADEIDSTFKTSFYKGISLDEAVLPESILSFAKAESGKKYYINLV